MKSAVPIAPMLKFDVSTLKLIIPRLNQRNQELPGFNQVVKDESTTNNRHSRTAILSVHWRYSKLSKLMIQVRLPRIEFRVISMELGFSVVISVELMRSKKECLDDFQEYYSDIGKPRLILPDRANGCAALEFKSCCRKEGIKLET